MSRMIPTKIGFAAVARLADGEIHRKYRPVLAPADDLAADAYDLLLAGAQIVREIRVMLARIGLRHQHFDVAPDQFLRGIAEEPFGRVVDRADCAVPVDDHDPHRPRCRRSRDRGRRRDPRHSRAAGSTLSNSVAGILDLSPGQEAARGYVPAKLHPLTASDTTNEPLGGTDQRDRRHRSQRRLISWVSIVSPAVDSSFTTSWPSRMRMQATAMAVLRSAAGARNCWSPRLIMHLPAHRPMQSRSYRAQH